MTRGGHQFDEHHPELRGFGVHYYQTILPGLRQFEADRKHAIKTGLLQGLSVAAVTMLASWAFWHFAANSRAAFMALCVGSVAAISRVVSPISKLKKTTKLRIMSGICRFFGWSFSEKFVANTNIRHFVELGLLFPHENLSKEDRVLGRAYGVVFESFEVSFTKGTAKSLRRDLLKPKFHGQVFSMNFERQFMGRTVVLRDKGVFNPKAKGDMKRVGLVDPVFEKIFEAYGTDQVEARYLLTPDFMQRLVNLESSIEGKNIRFGFLRNQLLIAVETKNKYEAGSMLKPLTDPARTQKILDEFGAIFDVVDGVLGKSVERHKRT